MHITVYLFSLTVLMDLAPSPEMTPKAQVIWQYNVYLQILQMKTIIKLQREQVIGDKNCFQFRCSQKL